MTKYAMLLLFLIACGWVQWACAAVDPDIRLQVYLADPQEYASGNGELVVKVTNDGKSALWLWDVVGLRTFRLDTEGRAIPVTAYRPVMSAESDTRFGYLAVEVTSPSMPQKEWFDLLNVNALNGGVCKVELPQYRGHLFSLVLGPRSLLFQQPGTYNIRAVIRRGEEIIAQSPTRTLEIAP